MARIKNLEFGLSVTPGIPKPGESSTPEKKHSFEPPGKKESNKTVFFLIAVLLIFIVIGVSLLIFIFMGKIIPPSPPTSNLTNVTANITTNGTVTGGCDDQCMLLLAQNTSSSSYCDVINDSSLKSQCYLALANVSLSSCLKTTGSNLLDCVTNHAVRNSDIGICTNLEGADNLACMVAVNPCYAKNVTERQLCLAISKNDDSLCAGDEECIIDFIKTTGDESACDSIANTVKKYACISIALKKDKCINLTLQSQKDLCYQIYAVETDDEATCNDITPNSIYALDCFSFFAINRSQYSICDSLTLNNRWACYSNFSIGTKLTSGCQAIDTLAYTSRFRCFYGYAKLYGDPSACDLIGDVSQTLTCYVGAIMNNTALDYTNCANIVKEQWKNKCYSQSAQNKNDSSICNYIETENEREGCKNLLS